VHIGLIEKVRFISLLTQDAHWHNLAQGGARQDCLLRRLPIVVDLLKALQQSSIAGGLFLLIGSLKRAWIRLFAKINPGTVCQGFVASSGIEPESRASETRILSVVLRGQLSEQEDRCFAIEAKVMFHPLLT
jgi:hypothetical protein